VVRPIACFAVALEFLAGALAEVAAAVDTPLFVVGYGSRETCLNDGTVPFDTPECCLFAFLLVVRTPVAAYRDVAAWGSQSAPSGCEQGCGEGLAGLAGRHGVMVMAGRPALVFRRPRARGLCDE
jgi:hypothetical protein